MRGLCRYSSGRQARRGGVVGEEATDAAVKCYMTHFKWRWTTVGGHANRIALHPRPFGGGFNFRPVDDDVDCGLWSEWRCPEVDLNGDSGPLRIGL